VESLEQHSLALIEVMKQVSNGKVKRTPDILVSSGVGGSGDQSASNVFADFLAR
jgi:hypothetical protein